jgi:hypothetical protein
MEMQRRFDREHSGARRRMAAAGVALLLTLLPAGCGGGTGPESAEFKNQVVTGKVVLASGRPLTRGRVALQPLQAPFGFLYGTLGPDGSFKLSTEGLSPGAPAGTGVSHGEFRVCIELDNYFPGSTAKPKGLNFPAKYLDPTTSGLTAKITPETNELPPFVLK